MSPTSEGERVLWASGGQVRCVRYGGVRAMRKCTFSVRNIARRAVISAQAFPPSSPTSTYRVAVAKRGRDEGLGKTNTSATFFRETHSGDVHSHHGRAAWAAPQGQPGGGWGASLFSLPPAHLFRHPHAGAVQAQKPEVPHRARQQ